MIIAGEFGAYNCDISHMVSKNYGAIPAVCYLFDSVLWRICINPVDDSDERKLESSEKTTISYPTIRVFARISASAFILVAILFLLTAIFSFYSLHGNQSLETMSLDMLPVTLFGTLIILLCLLTTVQSFATNEKLMAL